jgi:putative mRNA 3-end processing factor
MQIFLHNEGEVKLFGLPLWLDARARKPLNFISHAHADHIGSHRQIICTPATYELLKARMAPSPAVQLEYGEPYEVAGAGITLHPAGHVLGSAQILIEKGGQRILYTGDFRLGGGLTAEYAEPVACDVMLMECTYGHPRYRFPPREEIAKLLGEFIEHSFDDSCTPVLLAYSLGKAQEAIKMAEGLGYGALAHPAVWKICKVYEQFGISFPLLSLLGGGPVGRRVVVFPPQNAAREKLGLIGPLRTAILTGWSMDDRCRYLYCADECIPFSDHSDFPALVRAAKESGAGKIYTHHGDAVRFAEFLKAEGLDAEPLVPPAQKRLF